MAIFESKHTGQELEDFLDSKPNTIQFIGSSITTPQNGYYTAVFSIDQANIAGLYFFTYGNCLVILPINDQMSVNTEYKVAAALVNSGGSYAVKVLTYRLTSDGKLYIYSKENYIPSGYTTYLSKVGLVSSN